jgi:tRNA threonylcarbamoyladenosine biosynthesis protein TsaE
MTSDHLTYRVGDADTMRELGAALARVLAPGLRVHLHGELGAGKTTLARGLIQALGHDGPVKSPTYTLVEIYVVSGYIVYHFDFYRFNDPAEWREAGLDETFDDGGVCLVEWPEKAAEVLPPADLTIRIGSGPQEEADARTVVIKGLSERGTTCLDALRLTHPPAPG